NNRCPSGSRSGKPLPQRSYAASSAWQPPPPGRGCGPGALGHDKPKRCPLSHTCCPPPPSSHCSRCYCDDYLSREAADGPRWVSLLGCAPYIVPPQVGLEDLGNSPSRSDPI